jgi:hypothetical protein
VILLGSVRVRYALHSSSIHSYSRFTFPIALSLASLPSYRYIPLLPSILIPQRYRSSPSLLFILLSILHTSLGFLLPMLPVHPRLSLPYFFLLPSAFLLCVPQLHNILSFRSIKLLVPSLQAVLNRMLAGAIKIDDPSLFRLRGLVGSFIHYFKARSKLSCSGSCPSWSVRMMILGTNTVSAFGVYLL